MICVPSGFKKYTYNAASYLAIILRVVVSVISDCLPKPVNGLPASSTQPTNACPIASGAVGAINVSPDLTICVLTVVPFATKLNVVNGTLFSFVIT